MMKKLFQKISKTKEGWVYVNEKMNNNSKWIKYVGLIVKIIDEDSVTQIGTVIDGLPRSVEFIPYLTGHSGYMRHGARFSRRALTSFAKSWVLTSRNIILLEYKKPS